MWRDGALCPDMAERLIYNWRTLKTVHGAIGGDEDVSVVRR
jgi:hypothetical protein